MHRYFVIYIERDSFKFDKKISNAQNYYYRDLLFDKPDKLDKHFGIFRLFCDSIGRTKLCESVIFP